MNNKVSINIFDPFYLYITTKYYLNSIHFNTEFIYCIQIQQSQSNLSVTSILLLAVFKLLFGAFRCQLTGYVTGYVCFHIIIETFKLKTAYLGWYTNDIIYHNTKGGPNFKVVAHFCLISFQYLNDDKPFIAISKLIQYSNTIYQLQVETN